ncbi:MAG: radical SAM protein [Thermoplasmatales archaeon]|nr:MAG: radical SAM protein [Thermoplasmatales archaeon]
MIKEVEAKTILRKHKKIDSWFISQYGFNLYRGCMHNCLYCDGRSEKYNVNGEFGNDVTVKINAVEVLRRELDPKRKRTPLKKCFIMCGGGIGDSYQPVEKKYQLSRKTLQLLYEYGFPVSILTKSTLVKRDADIIKKINEQSRAIVSFSFSSVDDEISRVFEPGVPMPSERLEAIRFFKKEGIACGMFLLPVLPFITDWPEAIEDSIREAKNADVDFVIFGGMTLKDGRQKNYFLERLRENYPNLLTEYRHIYRGDKWGNPVREYYDSIHKTFNLAAKKYKMPKRIPPSLYKNIIGENDLVIVILEHLDYLLKLEGKPSPYGYAAYSISKLTTPISSLKDGLREIKGVGKTTEHIIIEILNTGSSSYYEKLLVG